MGDMTSDPGTGCPISLFCEGTHMVQIQGTHSEAGKPKEEETREEEEPHLSPVLMEDTEDPTEPGTMFKLNPDCWVWSPRPPHCLLPQGSGNPASRTLSCQEEEEEDAGGEEDVVVRCYTTDTGCHGGIRQTVDVRRSVFNPRACSGIPNSSSLACGVPGVPSVQRPAAMVEADQGILAQHFPGGCCCDGPERMAQSCVCVYGGREPEYAGHCWSGSPYICYGVRRNLVVGVEVVEEVAVEDSVELITEDVYRDNLLDTDLLHPELHQDAQMYPS